MANEESSTPYKVKIKNTSIRVNFQQIRTEIFSFSVITTRFLSIILFGLYIRRARSTREIRNFFGC